MTYTIQFSLEQSVDYCVKNVPTAEVQAIIASIAENQGRVNDVIAER